MVAWRIALRLSDALIKLRYFSGAAFAAPDPSSVNQGLCFMCSLRLLADDLTGALDSAAAFATSGAPVAVRWHGEVDAQENFAFDSATREADAVDACSIINSLSAMLAGGSNDIVYKKIDSLFRGHEAAELDVILRQLKPAYCIIAPAFPAQGRITRDGRQHADGPQGWTCIKADLCSELQSLGHAVSRVRPGDNVPGGISFWDAESDDDLTQIISAASGLADILWVGSGGLASALARHYDFAVETVDAGNLQLPILGLFGTEHPVTLAQINAVADHHVTIAPVEQSDSVTRMLASKNAAFVSVSVVDGTSRHEAAAQIQTAFSALLKTIPAPGTLIVAGGETLRGLCLTLDTYQLDVIGEFSPGIPCSVMRGGLWDGTIILSKSGAFGAPNLLQKLLAVSSAGKQLES